MGCFRVEQNPLVSVIIPCFNQESFIEESIESVVSQTYRNIEIICVDDCSTDNSLDLISKYVDLPNFKLIKNKKNLGVCITRNLAVEAARGTYILPLDGDDTIEPSYIEKAVNVISSDQRVGIVYCKARFIGGVNKEWDLPEYNPDDFMFINCIFCSALFRKSDFVKVGGYKSYMKYGFEDYELWVSMIESGIKPYRIDEILFNYRQKHKVSRSDELNSAPAYRQNMKKEIILHHLDFFLNNECFVKFITENSPKYLNHLLDENSQLNDALSNIKLLYQKKLKKYRNLLKIFCIIFVCLLVLIIYLYLKQSLGDIIVCDVKLSD